MAEAQAMTVTDAAARYDVPLSTLRSWVRLKLLRKGRMLKEGRWHTTIEVAQLEELLRKSKEGGEVIWEE